MKGLGLIFTYSHVCFLSSGYMSKAKVKIKSRVVKTMRGNAKNTSPYKSKELGLELKSS